MAPDDATADEPVPVQPMAASDSYRPSQPSPAGTGGLLARQGGRELRRNRAIRERSALLRRTIETEVLPRLVLALQPATAAAAAPIQAPADALAALSFAVDAAAFDVAVDAAGASGLSIARIHLDLLAPAAWRLGQWWDEDRCSFADVTLGIWRLQQAMYRLGSEFQRPARARPDQRRRALVVPLFGEQHGFGAAMVGEFLRRAGWEVDGERADTQRALTERVAGGSFAMVGLSIGGDDRLGELTTAIRAVRRASRNRDLGIMVGGPAFNARPELVLKVGADTTAADAEGAVRRAEELLRRRTSAAGP